MNMIYILTITTNCHSAATFIATKFLQNLAHASLVSKVCIWERDEGVADPWSIVTGKSGFDKLF